MSDILKKICALLKPGTPAEKQCAAAMILRELAPRDSAVVKALIAALSTDNKVLRAYLLDALKALKSRDALGAIIPLLSHDEETRVKAMEVVAAVGPSALPVLKKEWAKALPPMRANINSILVRMRKPEPFRILLDSLLGSEADLVKETAVAVRREAPNMSGEEKKALSKVALKFLESSAVKKSKLIRSNAIRIVAALGDPGSAKALFTGTTPENPPEVRRESLSGLAGFATTLSRNADWSKKLLSYLGENDFPNVVSQTLLALANVTLSPREEQSLVAFLKSRHPAVREFAARRLKEVDSAHAADALIPFLSGSDPALKDHAAASLARIPSARPALLREFLEADDVERSQLLAQILKPHGPTLRKDALKRILDRALELMERGDKRDIPYFYLLRHADPRFVHQALLAEGLRAKKAKKYSRAEAVLRPLEQNPLFDNDTRFELALVSLKSSSKDLGKEARSKDHALGLLRVLIADRSFPLLSRLKKEGALLDAEDWYFAGFHFAEGSGLERLFAKEALNIVVKKFPKAKVAAAARNKLKVEALD